MTKRVARRPGRPPTARSLALRALARRLVPSLVKQGALGVAVTGSAARGTAGDGSDLDLWVLAEGPRHRVHRRAFGQAVTLLFDSPASALDLDWLSYWEVDDLLVLHDAGGHFDAVRAAFARHRRRLARDVLAATREDLLHELHLAQGGSAWRRLLFLREAAFRAAGVWLFLRTGWRVPRVEVLRAALPAEARRTFDALEGWPSSAVARRALRPLPSTLRAVSAGLGRSAHDAGALHAPKELEARVEAGAWREAVHLARRHLLHMAWPAVLADGPAQDVTAPGEAAAALRPVTLALHRLRGVGEGDAAAVRRAGALLQRLVKQLGLAQPLGAPVVRAVARASRAPGLR